jgi:hypothetical protein
MTVDETKQIKSVIISNLQQRLAGKEKHIALFRNHVLVLQSMITNTKYFCIHNVIIIFLILLYLFYLIILFHYFISLLYFITLYFKICYFVILLFYFILFYLFFDVVSRARVTKRKRNTRNSIEGGTREIHQAKS